MIGSLVFALLIPYVALGQTLLYFDLQVAGRGRAGEAAALLAVWRRASSAGSSTRAAAATSG